jgi:hypothetical protein
LPVISETFEEFRSTAFRLSVSNLITNAPSNAPAGGFNVLPEDIREDAYKVCYFFDYMGTLIAYRIIGEEIVIGVMGTRLVQVWQAMKPAIESERKYRAQDESDAPPGFLVYYGYLMDRIEALGGKDAAKNIQRGLGILQPSGLTGYGDRTQDPDQVAGDTPQPDRE